MTASSTRLPGHDLAGYLHGYPQEIAFGDEEPAAVFDRYHTPDFILTNDGLPLDRGRLLAHVHSGRRRAVEIRTVVREVVNDGEQVAARYVLTAVMRRGQPISTEIFMFGRLAADGRLRSVTQLTRNVSDSPSHGPDAR
ncbi:nuclear transport factor 2 family protein [Micromonospora sp. Llam7]|uniref:nuclear transport factor 2 family protein n=1 Tax=Micromonospora tarapacensis TaxID=2835305 RepID=UPI001C83C5D1|nr:nuclear transport factor 2 family protein [Micromonospora tarapacensis]MBX7264698.1 nuclear transport factor 2 family protein [Micromonospora tarapacensis]